MTRKTSLSILGIGLLSLGAAAFAQTSAPMGRDGPGARPPMDRASLQTRLNEQFDARDTNKDGSLSVEERKAHRAQSREKMQARMFERLDADKNGQISKEEFAARHGGPRGERGEGKRGGMAGKHHGHHGGGMMMQRQLMSEYKDKAIPKAVFVNAGLAGFDKMDTDRDGKISPAERDAARKMMQEHRAMKRAAPTT